MPQLAPHIVRRLMKELAAVREDAHITHLSIESKNGDDDISCLKGSFPGPKDSPYEGGTFWVDIVIPLEYPFKPPHMKFITRVWHPNVSSQTGTICLDTIGKAWSPIFTLKSTLISLQSLLATPEPNDPQDAEVARMLLKHPKEYERVARSWSVKYAGAPRTEADNVSESALRESASAASQEEAQMIAQCQGFEPRLVQQFCSMGFDVPGVVEAFIREGIPRGSAMLSEVQVNNVTVRLLGE